MRIYARACFLIAVFLVVTPLSAWAHAFPEHQSPEVGAVLKRSPKAVIIRFDRDIEAPFCTLRVINLAGKRVDKKDTHAMPGRADTLIVSLPPLMNGRYHVYWTAIARDGHHTLGDYFFTVRNTTR